MIGITAIGELLVDFTPAGQNDRGVKLLAQNPGGAPANVLAMAARLGGKTAFIGKVGQDAFGEALQSVLNGRGIDTSGLLLDQTAHISAALPAPAMSRRIRSIPWTQQGPGMPLWARFFGRCRI